VCVATSQWIRIGGTGTNITDITTW
jgi:hypothetical protein